MKGKMKLLAGALLATLALGTFVAKLHAQGNVPKNDEIYELPEVEIACSGNPWGRCYTEDEYKMGWYIHHFCSPTGMQADYCPISIYLLNNY